MSARITARQFEERDIEPAAALLAARQRRDRKRLPMLAARFEDAAACAETVRDLARNPRVLGAVAEAKGQVVGFLFGEQMLFPPDALPSKWIEPHSISMPNEGHAAAESADVTAAYRAMYGWLAERWVAGGFFWHTTHIVPGDLEVQEAWVSLGFGRKLTAATRGTGPVEGVARGRVEVHQASAEDIDVIVGLSNTLIAHHWNSPMFQPVLPETAPANREYIRELLQDPANAHFVAYENGRAVGMDTFMRPGYIPATVELEGNVYLFQGIVSPEAQSGGIGKAILDHSMAWCREQGYEMCTLHFASANYSGAPFWLGQGFVPVEHAMVRHVDERVAWARP
jgi:GNAT superfamily N-acetyltransferase